MQTGCDAESRTPVEWTEHPNYPQQALLLESHAYYRRLCGWLIEQVAKVQTEVTGTRRRCRILKRIGQSFDDLIWGQSSHQRYEEYTLFPYLEACYLSISFDAFDADHRALESRARDVVALFVSHRVVCVVCHLEVLRSVRGFCMQLSCSLESACIGRCLDTAAPSGVKQTGPGPATYSADPTPPQGFLRDTRCRFPQFLSRLGPRTRAIMGSKTVLRATRGTCP